jgi:hypothetical protein
MTPFQLAPDQGKEVLVVDNRCAVEDLASAHRAVFSERSAAWISNTRHRWTARSAQLPDNHARRGERLSQSPRR